MKDFLHYTANKTLLHGAGFCNSLWWAKGNKILLEAPTMVLLLQVVRLLKSMVL